MTPWRRVVVAVAVVAGAVATTAGCGVPLEGAARPTPNEDVPYDLLDPATSTTTTAFTTDGAVLYLVGKDGLAPVRRSVPAPVGMASVIEALGQPASAEEEAKGLRSVLAPEDFVLAARSSGGVGRIDLADRFRSLPEREQQLALAQLVLTTTELVGVDRVVFTLQGAPLDVPAADGTLRAAPVTRDDYRSLLR